MAFFIPDRGRAQAWTNYREMEVPNELLRTETPGMAPIFWTVKC